MIRLKESLLPLDNEERLKYLFRLQELLRLLHNKKGQQYNDKKITEYQWKRFTQWFQKRNLIISKAINKCTKNIKSIQDYFNLTDEEQEKADNPIFVYKLHKKNKDININIKCFEDL